jgi:ribosomal protein S18 acetylase RimI-like enzyme
VSGFYYCFASLGDPGGLGGSIWILREVVLSQECNEARIEPVAEADVARLVALAREIWRAHYPAIIGSAQIEYMLAQRYSPEVVRAELAREGLWWDKLMAGEEMAGFASYFLTGAPGEMKLDKLYVHPAHQRRGHGARMIARACEVARERGCNRLVLAVNKGNREAIAAYRKHGFRVADAVVKDIGGGFVMDDYMMVKAIENADERR